MSLFHGMFLKHMLFVFAAFTFHKSSLKQLLWNLSPWPTKMSVVDSGLEGSVVALEHVYFHNY